MSVNLSGTLKKVSAIRSWEVKPGEILKSCDLLLQESVCREKFIFIRVWGRVIKELQACKIGSFIFVNCEVESKYKNGKWSTYLKGTNVVPDLNKRTEDPNYSIETINVFDESGNYLEPQDNPQPETVVPDTPLNLPPIEHELSDEMKKYAETMMNDPNFWKFDEGSDVSKKELLKKRKT
jgi:hypothetical protein